PPLSVVLIQYRRPGRLQRMEGSLSFIFHSSDLYHLGIASRTLILRRWARRSVVFATSAFSIAASASSGRCCASSISPARVQKTLSFGSRAKANEQRKSARLESVSSPASAI